MVNNRYAKAYTEVLEIISHFSEEEFNRIPKQRIDFIKRNMDKEYKFTINPKVDLSEQNISREANSIIVSLYLDYFATDDQKIKINEILKLNERKAEQLKRIKYNPNNLFKNENDGTKKATSTKGFVQHKDSIFTQVKKFLFTLLHKNK